MVTDGHIHDFREHPRRLEDLLNRIIPYARRVGEGAVIVMLLASAPDVAWAQVGFHPSPWAAVIVLFVLPALFLAGLVICGVGYFFYRRLWLFILGGAMMTPAIAFVVSIIPQLIHEMVPQKKFWDFSADRSVSRLSEKRKPALGEYYHYYKIRSTVKLPGNRQWSGKARRVVLTISDDEIRSINWLGRHGGLEKVYREAKRILAELGISAHDLDGWYDRMRRAEADMLFTVGDEAGNPEISVAVRGYQEKKKWKWAVEVDVAWKGVER